MSAAPMMMWVVRDHGIEGKAQPGRVVAVLESEADARKVDNWGYSHKRELMLFDASAETARFLGPEFKVATP